MKKKPANWAIHLPILWPTHRVDRVGVLAAIIFLTVLLVWSVNHPAKITIFFDFWKYPSNSRYEIDYNFSNFSLSSPGEFELVRTGARPIVTTKNVSFHKDINRNHNEGLTYRLQNATKGDQLIFDWISVEIEQNYTSNFLSVFNVVKGRAGNMSKTADIKFLNFDDTKSNIVLSSGDSHEFFFQALNGSGGGQCHGGDFFEVDLAGEFWRSRPPTKDLGNGTYSFILQVHPEFSGTYNLTIILLFRNFEGMSHVSGLLAYDKQFRKLSLTLSKSKTKLPELQLCKKSDFNRYLWSGRWIRLAKNDSCEISHDGRYRCLEPDHPCTKPWCHGSLGLLESSNGWVYSAHCSFRLFSGMDAWNCLNNRWVFFWGDSNHVDTIRNILVFFLGLPSRIITRNFDEIITNPKNMSQSIRITNTFNGHWDINRNHIGLKSLANETYRDFLKSYFNGSIVPDTVIFNSGLHDGIYWRRPGQFALAVDDMVSFWKETLEGVKKRGLDVPNFIFRSTVATSGYAREIPMNPHRMEVFNKIILEKIKASRLTTGVIDNFDMTWSWHFDYRCSDGIHYGRAPTTKKWNDGIIGHQYFVDLMLGHVILNAICPFN